MAYIMSTFFLSFFFHRNKGFCAPYLNPAAAASHRQHDRLYICAHRWLIDTTLTVQRKSLVCFLCETFLKRLFMRRECRREWDGEAEGVCNGFIMENECCLDRGEVKQINELYLLCSRSLLIQSC